MIKKSSNDYITDTANYNMNDKRKRFRHQFPGLFTFNDEWKKYA